ncbi:MAG: CotH kinase family protein [Planctomycetes bacterium]|nr:CotH kinase family protein [Planctomycetota bacterium]
MSRLPAIAARFLALALAALAGVPAGPAPAETVIQDFPLTVWAGIPPGREPREPGVTALPDLPFDPERGHGHVGGSPGALEGAAVFSGDPSWPAVWREGIEKHLFRVPRGEYAVELAFLETEVAWKGLRVFDVFAEEKELFPHLDIYERAGDFAWLVLAGRTAVYDGWLDLRFVPATGDRAPRVSRITVSRIEEGAPPPEAPRLEARSGLGQVLLSWSRPASPGVTGYGVFRSELPSGPFDPIAPEPVSPTRFIDATAAPGSERHYKVCAFTAGGQQSPFSAPASAEPRPLNAAGLRAYELKVPDDAMRRLGARSDPPPEVEGELHVLGEVYYVLVSIDASPGAWQRKKTFLVTPQLDRNRSVLRRKSLRLSPEAGDATLLREAVSAGAAAALGLAAPAVEPVLLVVNGSLQGVYHDVEAVDRRFRVRLRLDRVGLLARDGGGDLLRPDWAPYGEQRGEEGNLMGLTELVHELNRLGQGETRRFFEERFYLDRLLDRFAFQAVRGAPGRRAAERLLLKDSRNGKWELFEELEPDGSWGIHDFDAAPRALGVEEARRLLRGLGLQGTAPGEEPSVLETRLLGDPELRERLFARIEEVLAGPLAPERFDGIVDEAFSRVREAALADPWRWRGGAGGGEDRGDAFLQGPAALKAAHRARAEVLRRAVAAERARPKPRLELSEILALPAGGEPWVEVRNASASPVSLAGFHLASSLEPGARRAFLPVGEPLPPGGHRLLRRGDLRLEPAGPARPFDLPGASGGFLALWREAAGGPELCDFAFFAPATRGIAYGRAPEAPRSWSHLERATPGEANAHAGRRLVPPTYEMRQGMVKGKDGALTVWLKAKEPAGGPGKIEKVTLRYREARAGPAAGTGTTEPVQEPEGAFASVDLAWDKDLFQHSITLAPNAERKRTAYYFVVTSAVGVERAFPLPAPDLTFFLPEPVPAKLNEVLPRPSRAPGSPGEFVEVYNPSEAALDLEGCFLTDTSRNTTRWRIPPGFPVPPKGFRVFYADGSNRGEHASFKLSNSGEFLGLYGRMEEGNLLIDSMAFRGVRTGESWGASPDGSKSFRSWKDPTPGKRNIPKIPEEYLKKKREEEAAGGKASGAASGPATEPPLPGGEGPPGKPPAPPGEEPDEAGDPDEEP